MDQIPFPSAADDPLAPGSRARELQQQCPAAAPVLTRVGDPAWLVSGHAEVRTLFNDTRLGRSHPAPEEASRFSDGFLLGGPMLNHETEEADHRRMRRLLGPAFGPRRMERMRQWVRDRINALLDPLTPPADLHRELSIPLPVMVICELLGAPYTDHDKFRTWSESIGSVTDAAAASDAFMELFAYMTDLIATKRENPGEDVVSDLIAAQAREPDLADDEITFLSVGLLFAGHETTLVNLDRALVRLLREPGPWQELCDHPDRIPTAVEELLRLGGPTALGGIPRYAHCPVETGGTTLEPGDAVVLANSTANYDPAVFDDPDRMDLTRAPNPHLTFGHGAHFCLGASLARVELQECLGALVDRYPTLRLTVDPGELDAKTDTLTGGYDRIPVAW